MVFVFTHRLPSAPGSGPDATLRGLSCLLQCLLAVRAPLVSDELQGLEEDPLEVQWTVPQMGSVRCFCHGQAEAVGFGKEGGRGNVFLSSCHTCGGHAVHVTYCWPRVTLAGMSPATTRDPFHTALLHTWESGGMPHFLEGIF